MPMNLFRKETAITVSIFAIGIVCSGVVLAEPETEIAAEVPSIAAETESATWEYSPIVQMAKSDGGMKVIVEPHLLMDRTQISNIQGIRLEGDKGQFLGLKSFNKHDIKRRAEFLVDSNATKSGNVKVIVQSDVNGNWESVVPLEETAIQTTVYTTAPEIPEVPEVNEAVLPEVTEPEAAPEMIPENPEIPETK